MTRNTVVRGVIGSIVVAALAGCLRRDVAAEEPTTKSSFATVVPQPAIDKVDLLIMVDNSSSMADKQRILADAVPDLLRGLVQPKCVDKTTRVPSGTLADPLKAAAEQCPTGTEPAFPPITDMHIGIISSSLGGMGSNSCGTAPGHHNDDHGRLVARGKDGKDLPQAGDMHFLAWYPDVEQNTDKVRHPEPPVPATKSLATLSASFRELVTGIGQDGCGLEAQLESVYRFLVQPDPWTAIAVADGRATYGAANQVDNDLLRQRAAFLRPNSLVAVVILSDEDDSSVDPLAFQGTAWRFEQRNDISKECPECLLLPRATAACASSPAAAQCTSCAFAAADPACATNGGVYAPAEDPLNVRFHAMKRRFGVDPQFPIARYVDGFTNTKVPSRDAEHVNGTYVGKTDCTNPLFAAHLPSETNEERCKLPRGPRTKDLVYFAVIGGVPNQLLPAQGGSAAIDWTRILGKDPATYDETGIDPHMIASTEPRANLPPPSAADDADPIHGREWATGGTDLQFACTFPLYEIGADGRSVPATHECLAGDTLCDCDGQRSSPLCAKANPRSQVRGKAYPTRRELQVVRDLGDHGIAASLCPKQLSAPDAEDYGYRPAVRAITDRLEGSLVASCVPHALARDPGDGSVPCLVLATLATPGPDSVCASLGLGTPRAEVLESFRDRVAADEGEGSRLFPVCEVPQVVVAPGGSCRGEDTKLGFCYAEGIPGAACPQSLVFTKATAQLIDARFTLQCIQVSDKPTPL
ncbi:MAG TPA: hypothetical protein VLT33_05705 [Labilithrix sp.]|nr:hypothetical protein [Labilithrix sp.]